MKLTMNHPINLPVHISYCGRKLLRLLAYYASALPVGFTHHMDGCKMLPLAQMARNDQILAFIQGLIVMAESFLLVCFIANVCNDTLGYITRLKCRMIE